jgi:hypothetical protein
MASNLKYSASLKNSQQAAINTIMGNSALINLMGGPQPTNPDTALANTTLSATITTSQTTIVLTSATGFPASGYDTLWVGTEQMTVTGGQGTATLTVTRGVNGSTALASTSGTAITNTPILATLTCNASGFGGTPSGGVLTALAITGGTGTTVAGIASTANWFRSETSGTTPEIDGSVGTTGCDINLSSTTISAGLAVAITSWTLTNGN